jgi:hypothetical protein
MDGPNTDQLLRLLPHGLPLDNPGLHCLPHGPA